MKCGDIIVKLREEKGMQQKELAKALNIGSSRLSHYENNRREIDNETLVKIADYFSVTTDFLLGRTKFRNARLVKKDELEDFLDEETIKRIEEDELEFGVSEIGKLDTETKKEIIKLLREHGYLKA
ncbi:MAG TPA: helix-turn-helix transcriptional regulator [Thermoanaerobacterales bacterium]|nr:helix-turn-helix transcriptional regulator [Thermoanaerobacterales bacterium]